MSSQMTCDGIRLSHRKFCSTGLTSEAVKDIFLQSLGDHTQPTQVAELLAGLIQSDSFSESDVKFVQCFIAGLVAGRYGFISLCCS